ncbi:hypothetical protein LEP1GSC074_3872 [Leptospira noguchii str. Hook]|nr:hypothetical protein LEP1GSC074_3872 [Leptospira noguchii str. Hook]
MGSIKNWATAQLSIVSECLSYYFAFIAVFNFLTKNYRDLFNFEDIFLT